MSLFRIYVDVILNHMAGNMQDAKGTGSSTAEPDKLLYPEVPYGPEHFNKPPCEMKDWQNVTQVTNSFCFIFPFHLTIRNTVTLVLGVSNSLLYGLGNELPRRSQPFLI
jgi:hypothetical protein